MTTFQTLGHVHGNGGALAALAADRFAEEDRRHGALLGWLEAHGFGSTPQDRIPPAVLERAHRELAAAEQPPAPRAPAHPEAPAPPAQEEAMPCSKCSQEGHNARSCRNEKPAPAEKPKHGVAAARAAKGSVVLGDPPKPFPFEVDEGALCSHTVAELVRFRGAIEAELKRRKDEAENMIRMVNEALGA